MTRSDTPLCRPVPPLCHGGWRSFCKLFQGFNRGVPGDPPFRHLLSAQTNGVVDDDGENPATGREAETGFTPLSRVGDIYPGCRHLDGDRTNPRLENLAWGTKVENEADKELHGTVPRGDRNGSRTKPHRLARGERAHGAKLTLAQRREVKFIALAGDLPQREVAERYGIHQSRVSQIMREPLAVRVRTPSRVREKSS